MKIFFLSIIFKKLSEQFFYFETKLFHHLHAAVMQKYFKHIKIHLLPGTEKCPVLST